MKTILIYLILLGISSQLVAHPSIGIVKDSKGNIYYTDTKNVWRINPSGKKEIVVRGVHTHELYIDKNDNLYGEHLWYNGGTQTWAHYEWCLKSSGELIKGEKAEGFLNEYSFVRDSVGNMYWVERFKTTKFMKKAVDGTLTKIAEGKFGFIGWIYATPGGVIYFTESNSLKKITPDGKVVELAGNLGSKTTDFTVAGRNYDGYGIWTDNADNIYIAMIDGRKVNKITPDGKLETILYSDSYWVTCSGIFDNNGNLWVLENSPTNEMRVRKIEKEELSGLPAASSFGNIHLLATVSTMLAILVVGFGLKLMIRKKLLSKSYNT